MRQGQVHGRGDPFNIQLREPCNYFGKEGPAGGKAGNKYDKKITCDYTAMSSPFWTAGQVFADISLLAVTTIGHAAKEVGKGIKHVVGTVSSAVAGWWNSIWDWIKIIWKWAVGIVIAIGVVVILGFLQKFCKIFSFCLMPFKAMTRARKARIDRIQQDTMQEIYENIQRAKKRRKTKAKSKGQRGRELDTELPLLP